MNTPEITIGSKWRHNASGKIATVLAITGEDVIYTRPFANGWAWMKERAFREWFSPYVWTLDEAMAEAGHVLGPGQQWHKPEEFSEADLPLVTDGGLPWRPTTQNEPMEPDDEFWEFGSGHWVKYKYRHKYRQVYTATRAKSRTRRPPPAVKVEEWIPLGPEDVPPGSVLRFAGERYWQAVVGTAPDGIYRICRDVIKHLTWHEAMTHYDILRPSTTEWQPCKKLKEVSL